MDKLFIEQITKNKHSGEGVKECLPAQKQALETLEGEKLQKKCSRAIFQQKKSKSGDLQTQT